MMVLRNRIALLVVSIALTACVSGQTGPITDQSLVTAIPEVEVSSPSVDGTGLVGTWIYQFVTSSRDHSVLFQSLVLPGSSDGGDMWMDYAEEGKVVHNDADGYETTAIATMTILGGPSPVTMQFLIEHSGSWDLDGGRVFMVPEDATASPLNEQAIAFVDEYGLPAWLEPDGIILVYTLQHETPDSLTLQSLSPLAGIDVTMRRAVD